MMQRKTGGKNAVHNWKLILLVRPKCTKVLSYAKQYEMHEGT